MKTKLLKILMPLGLALILSIFTIWGLVGCEPVCAAGQMAGSNGHCYACTGGGHPTHTYEGAGCSAPTAGVYCCPGGGGGGGCHPTGCPSDHPWLCGASCYVTPPSGNHACIKCP